MPDVKPCRVTNEIGSRWVDVLIAQYDGANNRRSQNFTFFWQAAALGLTAQAFLFNVALSGGTSDAGRYIAASLSLGASVATLVLMRTQKVYQHVEGAWMDTLEREFNFPVRMLHDAKAKKRAKRLIEHLNSSTSSLEGNDKPINEAAQGAIAKLEGATKKIKCELFWNATLWWRWLNRIFVAGAGAVIWITHCHPHWLH